MRGAHSRLSDRSFIPSISQGHFASSAGWLGRHLRVPQEAAIAFARIAGTYTTWKETVQTETDFLGDAPTGMKSQREVEEFYISPNVINQLQRGEAGLVVKHPGFYVDVVPLDYPQPKERVAFKSPWA